MKSTPITHEQRQIQLLHPIIFDQKVCYGTGKITDLEIPSYSGLYLIGEINYEDDTNRLVHKVKVGKGNNLNNRLNRYNTYTTSAQLFDYAYVEKHNLSQSETKFQHMLKNNGWQIGNTEWYVVSEEVYSKLKQYGFSGFSQLNT